MRADGLPAEFGDPILEERSLVATVLGTHAPPDTMVVSLEIGFASAGQAFPAYLYLLLDAKVLQSALEALEKGSGPSARCSSTNGAETPADPRVRRRASSG